MTHDAGPVLSGAGLVRQFGRRRAVAGVDVALEAGECLALFGPNGAGKTTLLRLLSGLLKPTAGRVAVGGRSLREDASARSRIGLISHQSMLYRALTPRENLAFGAALYGIPDAKAAVDRALERMGVLEWADTAVRALSRGLQQRVSIARAVVHRPSVVLLDEPYTGLDASGAAALTAMLQSLRADGAALVLVTHNVDEGLSLASHAAIMIGGRFVRHEPAAGIDARGYTETYREIAVRGAGSRAVAGAA